MRSLRPDDLPEVAALRRRAFRLTTRSTPAVLLDYCERVFLRNPWVDPELPSLVCEDGRGRIAGFLGVIPRPMLFQEERIRVAVASQLMVAPESRGLPALELLRAFLAGPQDLSWSDAANGTVRRLWHALKGGVSVAESLTWERALRPCRYVASRTLRGAFARPVRFALRPLLTAGDVLIRRLTDGFGTQPPPGKLEPLDAATIADQSPGILSQYALRPVYRREELEWLLALAAEKREFGDLRGAGVRGPDGRMAGWFLHFVARGGTSQTLQMAALPEHKRLVLAHLLHDASRRGAIAIAGRLQRDLITVLGAWRGEPRGDGPWAVLHSHRPEIVQAIERGDAFVSRLDGEWILSF